MKVKEKQAAQRQIDIDTDSFRLKDQEEKLQAGRYIVELVSAVLAGREQDERTEQREQRAEKKRQCVYYSGIVYVRTGNCGSSYLDKQPDSKCTV